MTGAVLKRRAPHRSLLGPDEQARREGERALRAAARASRAPRGLAESAPSAPAGTTWRQADLPGRALVSIHLPPAEVLTALLAGTLLYLPVVLFTGWSGWHVLAGAVLLGASAALLLARHVVAGRAFVAVRKTGPYRVVSPGALRCTQLVDSAFGGVLRMQTGDGRTVRLRRAEFSDPGVRALVREVVLASAHPYDDGARALLDLPRHPEYGHR